MIKKSFTMVELIFVILIVSILAVVVSPQFCGTGCNKDLMKAANQVLGHIRYVRHLAMIDNKFVPNINLSESSYTDDQKEKDTKQWFKKWWQIYFFTDKVGYAIFSDTPNDSTGSTNDKYDNSPNQTKKLAIDPLTSKYLIAYNYNGQFSETYLKLLNLGTEYSLSSVTVTNGCNTNHILFDNFGRAHCDKSLNDNDTNPYNRLMTQKGIIQLTQGSESISICIEPETGYSYIAYNNNCS